MKCFYNNTYNDYYDDNYYYDDDNFDNNSLICECNSFCLFLSLVLVIFTNCALLYLCFKCIMYSNNKKNTLLVNEYNNQQAPPLYDSIA